MKIAVLLCSMGGPDSLSAVRPFLFRLFNDPSILRVWQPLRWLLARTISCWRAPEARRIYQKIGGASPLLAHTQAQANALEQALADLETYRCFVGMSYWHPLIEETLAKIRDWDPDKLIILPLYPQSSTTTTGSVLRTVEQAMACLGMSAKVRHVPAFCTQPCFWKSLIELARPIVRQASSFGAPRLLFSAHSLPQAVVEGGDSYPHQCEETVRLFMEHWDGPPVEPVLCYQSKVGPLRWIGPSTSGEIVRAARTGNPVVVVPMAFVSEHVETLVELGQAYRELARASGAPFYDVVKTVGTYPAFIDGLAARIREINQDGAET